jgi:L-alanine-DL-glutamate epimerase-like enolase superfamily enzyme
LKITGWRIGRLRVPLAVPFRTALREVDRIDDVVLQIETDNGAIGHGSAAATAMITGETHASIEAAWRGHLLPAIRGGEIAGLPALLDRLQRAMAGNPSAKAAVDMALHDLAAQAAALPLHRFLGSAVEGWATLDTDITISANPLATMLTDVQTALAAGYRALKLKVGKHRDDDLAIVLALHEAVGGRATLRLDANQGWPVVHAIAVMRALEARGVGIELLEQPVPADDLDGMAAIGAAITTPLLADECVFSARDAERALAAGAADVINLKLMKSGGLAGVSRVAAVARHQGVPCMVGCMLESSVGAAAAAHFALANPDIVRFIDLDSPGLARFDPVDGNVAFDGPRITVGDTPGLGIRAIAGLELLEP